MGTPDLASAKQRVLSDIERQARTWIETQAAIKAEFEAEEQRRERSLEAAKRDVEAEIDREAMTVVGSQPMPPSVRRFYAEMRSMRLKVLQERHDQIKVQRQAAHDKRLLDHLERYRSLLAAGFGTLPTSVTVSCLPPR
jgi:hypothetical protein